MSKETALKEKQESGGYSYSYGGAYSGYSAVGYGYGENAGGEGGVQRTLHDYLLILRERIWYIVVVFLVVFSSSLVFTLSDTKIYQSNASVQIFRSDPTVMPQGKQVLDTDIRSAEDINTQIKVIESGLIAQRVAERLKGKELADFLAPYERTTADTAFVGDLLVRNRKVTLQRLTLFVLVGYQHPDRFVAANIANLFAEEYINHNKALRYDYSKDALAALVDSVNKQRQNIDALAKEIQKYKEEKKMPSLDAQRDVVNESLKAVNLEATRALLALSSAQSRIDQIKERRASGAELTELPFIANAPLVAQLTQQLAAQKIQIAQLEKRYRAPTATVKGHPTMIGLANQLTATQQQLSQAIAEECAKVEADYQSHRRNFEEAKKQLDQRSAEALDLDRLKLDYDNRARELKTQESLLQEIITRQTQTSMTSTLTTQNARIVDRAVAPPEARPISPNVPLNLGLGLLGGLGLGLAFALFVAFIDDRVKSSFDIEGVIGLPLIGIIPQIKRLEQAEKAQIVVNNADRQVAEAFLTLHSSLRLKDESKNAKCVLITSTIPGEGKSFTTTNLALTFAAHGERVAIVDCDLRKPNIHKSFKIENLKGVIDVCAGKATIGDVIVRNVQPNLDVIPAGGRAKNPTQVLNSKGFEIMLSELRKSYDRIFIDTPPLAAVSDALIILPLVDGSIFTIFFNKVRRKAAQFAAKKLMDSNVPNFGAVLNGLNLAVSGYYYAQYYDKSYKDYYVVMAKEDESTPQR